MYKCFLCRFYRINPELPGLLEKNPAEFEQARFIIHVQD